MNNELASKEYVDDIVGEDTVPGFNRTLENYLKVSVGNAISSLTKISEIQITEPTIIKTGNTALSVLPCWRSVCYDKKNNGKVSNFIETKKNKQPNKRSFEQHPCLRSEMVLCILKRAPIITEILFFSASNK